MYNPVGIEKTFLIYYNKPVTGCINIFTNVHCLNYFNERPVFQSHRKLFATRKNGNSKQLHRNILEKITSQNNLVKGSCKKNNVGGIISWRQFKYLVEIMHISVQSTRDTNMY